MTGCGLDIILINKEDVGIMIAVKQMNIIIVKIVKLNRMRMI